MSEALEASKSGQQAAPSVAAALADMFPTDIQALIDVAGKKFLHTVSACKRDPDPDEHVPMTVFHPLSSRNAIAGW